MGGLTAVAVSLLLWKVGSGSGGGGRNGVRVVSAFQTVGRWRAIVGEQKRRPLHSSAKGGEEAEEEKAQQWQNAAERLRKEIAELEDKMGRRPPPSPPPSETKKNTSSSSSSGRPSLSGKRVLVVGANGRLGSMVCRHLLRNHPTTQVLAAVHRLSENSANGGFARLSYEVGAEDGKGQIRPFWQGRYATFTFTPEMASYNLQNLRIFPLELLDALQCATLVEESAPDAIVWCAAAATSNGLLPSIIFSLGQQKESVQVDGLRNLLQPFGQFAAPNNKDDNGVTQLVLISPVETAAARGNNADLQREQQAVLEEIPHVSWTILQMTRLDDFFAQEGLNLLFRQECSSAGKEQEPSTPDTKPILSRRDAARAAVEALTKPELQGNKVQVSAIAPQEVVE